MAEKLGGPAGLSHTWWGRRVTSSMFLSSLYRWASWDDVKLQTIFQKILHLDLIFF